MEKLKTYLKEQNISVMAFANSIGKERQSVYDWISGKTTPKIKNAFLIEKATNGFVKVKDWHND